MSTSGPRCEHFYCFKCVSYDFTLFTCEAFFQKSLLKRGSFEEIYVVHTMNDLIARARKNGITDTALVASIERILYRNLGSRSRIGPGRRRSRR
jgi:hypothetical protein